jgi:hypothetical protein
VPEAVYAALFETPVLQQLDRFVVRNPQLTFEDLRELRKAAPGVTCFEVTTNFF